MIEIIAGALVGHWLGGKYLTPKNEAVLWTQTIDETIFSITQLKHRGKVVHKLYVTQQGNSTCVMQGEYAAVLAALQSWDTYVREGGTVTAWRTQNERRAAEVERLEKSL